MVVFCLYIQFWAVILSSFELIIWCNKIFIIALELYRSSFLSRFERIGEIAMCWEEYVAHTYKVESQISSRGKRHKSFKP